MSTLLIDESPVAGGVVVRLRGSLGLSNMPDLDRAVLRLSAAKHPLIIIDLAGVPVVASLAMGSLLRLAHVVKESGGTMRLSGLSPNVMDSFGRARVNRLLATFPTVEAAMAQDGPAPGSTDA